MLSVLEKGEVRGLATATGRTWMLGSAVADGPDGPGGLLQVREVDGAFELEEPGGGFRCEVDELGPAAFRAGTGDAETDLVSILEATPAPAGASEATAGAFDHTAVIAIETDNEFLALAPFGNNPALAVDYIADLVAYSSSIYVDELQTAWSLGYVSLWGPTLADPWVQTGTACSLIDYGRWWNNNRAGVERTVTHFLSGKSTNAGVAWIGVLCRSAFSIDAAAVASGCSPPLTGVSNWGGGYGYTSGVDGNFNIGSPSVVWDIQAFTHEIGHNFNSGHTHCYQNIGGNAAAVDNCYNGQCGSTGCFCGTPSAPRTGGRRGRHDHELLPPARRWQRQSHARPRASLRCRAGARAQPHARPRGERRRQQPRLPGAARTAEHPLPGRLLLEQHQRLVGGFSIAPDPGPRHGSRRRGQGAGKASMSPKLPNWPRALR